MTPRALAVRVLARVAATDAYLNAVLDAQLSESPPKDPRDAALATELCYGTSRRELALDSLLTTLCDRPLEKLEDRVLAALRIGAYQLFYTRIPKRAAVAATVEALKELGVSRATGFANAVLRKASRLEALPLPPQTEQVRYLAMRESHPEWLVARWLRQYGPARTEAMLVADNVAPPVVVRVNTARAAREEVLQQLLESGLDVRPTQASPVGIILPPAGRVEDLLGYPEGLWQVQDEAAQLVGVYAAIPEGARVLDACAAPGGKACHLAERCDVVATDLHQNKLRKIEAEARRLGLSERIKVLQHDATTAFPARLGKFDAVLIDAPCSGLGTLRRHPELRSRRKEADLARLAALQRDILERCQAVAKPDGLFIYAVCSTDPEEGADQVEMFLRSHPDFTADAPALPYSLPMAQAWLRTLPGPEGLDGFFAARLRRAF
jgi:16S rRNA (cytosine967-C5)-methyltransferase